MPRRIKPKTPEKTAESYQTEYSTTELSRGALSAVLDRVYFKRHTIFIKRKGQVIAKLAPSNSEEAKVVSDLYANLTQPGKGAE